jgi:hypothetical protein
MNFTTWYVMKMMAIYIINLPIRKNNALSSLISSGEPGTHRSFGVKLVKSADTD